jgi:hypothetical protein
MGLLEANSAAVRTFVQKAKANQVTPPKPVVAAALTFGLQPLHVAATMRDDGTTTEWTVVTMVDDGLVVVDASCGVSNWSWSKSQRDDKATVEVTFYPFWSCERHQRSESSGLCGRFRAVVRHFVGVGRVVRHNRRPGSADSLGH